jgi:hypothetical protein
MDEREQLIALCQRLGSTAEQAAVMADQLRKRCDQLVRSRGLTRTAAMEYLLQLLVKGASGEAPPGFEGVGAPPAASPAPERKPVDGTDAASS